MTTPGRLVAGFDGWRTPLDLAQEVRGVFGGTIGLDPCTEACNHLRAIDYYVAPGTGTEDIEDGLTRPWNDRTWCNPPYGQLRDWLLKVLDEHAHGHRIGLLLSVSRTEQEYLQDVIRASSCFMFLKGKLKFNDAANTGQLASWIFWFNVAPDVVNREMGWRGTICSSW